MADLFNFREEYRQYSNEQLLDIMANAAKYRREAVAAAREEWESRGEKQAPEAVAEHKQVLALRERSRKPGSLSVLRKHRLFRYLNPWERGISAQELQLRWMALCYCALVLYSLVKTNVVWTIIHDWPLSPMATVSNLIYPLMLLLSALFFWIRLRVGWFLLVISMLFILISSLSVIVLRFSRSADFFFSYIPVPGPFDFILPLIVAVSYLLAARLPYVREVFRISTATANNTFIFASVLVALQVLISIYA